jgi:hypothetical protein
VFAQECAMAPRLLPSASGEGSFANVPSTVAGTCTYELSPGSQGVNAYGVGTFTVQIEQTGYVTQTVPQYGRQVVGSCNEPPV